MSSYFFIKLFHEVLHDPKMGRLTDDLWRRTIEVFLLAGEYAAARHLSASKNDGLLPPVNDMAWTLRLSIEKLESDLAALEKCNIVGKTIGGQWIVVNFTKRQAAIDGAERVAAYRDRGKKEQYYESETPLTDIGNASVTSRYTELDIDKELDIEVDLEPEADRASAKHNGLTETQQLLLSSLGAKRFKNHVQRDAILEWNKYPPENVKAAIIWAARKGFALGQAIESITSALPKWGAPKPNGNKAETTMQAAIRKSREKELANGNAR